MGLGEHAAVMIVGFSSDLHHRFHNPSDCLKHCLQISRGLHLCSMLSPLPLGKRSQVRSLDSGFMVKVASRGTSAEASSQQMDPFFPFQDVHGSNHGRLLSAAQGGLQKVIGFACSCSP